MIARCPRCGDEVDAGADGRAGCPRCGAGRRMPPAVVAPGPAAADEPNPFAFTDPVPAVPPVYIPVPVPGGSPELVREQVEDLRDRRDDRRERRGYDREDRVSNPVGVAGAAVTGTAVLLVLSGALFGKDLRAYGWFAAVVALGLSLLGLPLSIIGALRPGRQRAFAVAGVVTGGLLVLVLVPALMLHLSNLK